jgi:hypothetical protein
LGRAPSLESLALDFLPRRYLSAASAAQLAHEDFACAICLEAYEEGAEVRGWKGEVVLRAGAA